jgi:hypothetical protein
MVRPRFARHLRSDVPLPPAAVAHTRRYRETFDQIAASTAKWGDIVAAMKTRHPDIGLAQVLELGAKVAAGDMPKWD